MSRRLGQERITRSKSFYGYFLSPEESHVWMYVIAITGGSAEGLTGNIEPIASGATQRLIDAFTGNNYLHSDAGEDYLLKAVYFNFDQQMLFEMTQTIGGTTVHTCVTTYPANCMPVYTPWYIGWSRSLLEDVDEAGDTIMQITNQGLLAATGKAWVLGFSKKGAYEWL